MNNTAIKKLLQQFIAAANAFDTAAFMQHWHTNAALDDSSVGRTFKGHAAIQEYFEAYFIGYKTQTRLVELNIVSPGKTGIVVDFTGDFPGGQASGTFDFVFKNGKIASAKAELV